jgi:hypothetical protein
METVWGNLSSLDVSDTELMVKILRWDKHTITEGFIAENLVEQILERVSDDKTIRRLKVRTSIAVNPKKWEYHAFVWTEEKAEVIIPYLDILAKKFIVYVVRYVPEEKEFMSSETPYQTGSKLKLTFAPLQNVLHVITGSSPDFHKLLPPDSSVRDTVRHNQAIWGFMSVLYRRDIFTAAVLPRIFMNFGANLYFGLAWDVDRVYIVNGNITVLEVKHKDPFPHSDNPKSFGINKGSLGLLEKISGSGAECYHLVLVKPVWDKEVSSMYLLGNLEAREKALLVGCKITKEKINRIKKGKEGQSGKNTSFSGKGTLVFYPIPVTDFHIIGSLSAPVEENAERIRKALTGEQLPGLTIQALNQRRIKL